MRIGRDVALEYCSSPSDIDVAGGLLDPVAAGDAQVEQALGHVHRDLLRPQDADRLDPRVVDGGLVVDGRGPVHREVRGGEQLQRGLLQRTLGQNQLQHGVTVPVRPVSRPKRCRAGGRARISRRRGGRRRRPGSRRPDDAAGAARRSPVGRDGDPRRPPSFMPATPWSQPAMTWPAPRRNPKVSPRSHEASNCWPWTTTPT